MFGFFCLFVCFLSYMCLCMKEKLQTVKASNKEICVLSLSDKSREVASVIMQDLHVCCFLTLR